MQNLTFSDYYNKLPNPRKDFIKSISDITGRSPRTIYYWIQGKGSPSDYHRKLISEFLNIPINNLFPAAKI
jgi:hypothetical protein